MDNFVSVFQNAAFQQAAKNTLTFSFVAVPLAVGAVPCFLAMLLESKMPFKSQFRTFFFKSYDGSYRFGSAYLAGSVPL